MKVVSAQPQRRVLQGRHLAAGGEHVPGRGVRPCPEVVIAEHELLGEPAIEGDDLVVVDLCRQSRVVTHREMHPGVAVVRLVGVRWRAEKLAVTGDRSTPFRQRRKIEVGRLVLLQEHDHPMPRDRSHSQIHSPPLWRYRPTRQPETQPTVTTLGTSRLHARLPSVCSRRSSSGR